MRKRDDRSTTGDLMHQILQTEIASGEEIMIVVMTDKEVLVLTKGSWTKATDRKKGVRAINDAIKAGWPDPLEGLVESEFKVRPFELPRPQSPMIAPSMETVV
jgi:hypothetical protein